MCGTRVKQMMKPISVLLVDSEKLGGSKFIVSMVIACRALVGGNEHSTRVSALAPHQTIVNTIGEVMLKIQSINPPYY
jgi:hypothetical protein